MAVVDGSVEVDGSGTDAEIRAELASETLRTPNSNGRFTRAPEAPEDKKPAVEPKPETTPQADGHSGDDDAFANADSTVTDAAASQAAQTLGKKKKSLQARIDEISAQRHATARERDDARAEVTRLQTELDAAKGIKKPVVKADVAKVKVAGVELGADRYIKYEEWIKTAPADKNDLEDFMEARDEWREARADAKREADLEADIEANKVPQSFLETKSEYDERMAPVLKADPKFYDKIDSRLTETQAASALPQGKRPVLANYLVDVALTADDPAAKLEQLTRAYAKMDPRFLGVSPARALPKGEQVKFEHFIAEQVLRQDDIAGIVEWLGEPGTIRRLVTLPPEDIIGEFTKKSLSLHPSDADRTGSSDEERLEGNDERPAARQSTAIDLDEVVTSRAHPPVRPVRGSSQQSADKEPGDDASDDEWYRHERAKQRAAAGGRRR